MDDEQSSGWPTWAVIVSILVALLIGMFLGWVAHGLMMHQMMGGGMMNGGMMGMMGDRGMMGSMMNGSKGESGMSRSAMMARCQSMMGEGGCPMMQASGDTERQSKDKLDSPLFDELDQKTRKWVTTIRGNIEPKDARGQDNVTVKVGAGDQGLSFGSPVLRIDPGTTVTFRWTGRGGVHNVNVLDSDWKSSLTYEQGTTYEVTFDESGVYRYVCDPHRPLGMKGIVIVG